MHNEFVGLGDELPGLHDGGERGMSARLRRRRHGGQNTGTAAGSSRENDGGSHRLSQMKTAARKRR
jgi:hypothetical protein